MFNIYYDKQLQLPEKNKEKKKSPRKTLKVKRLEKRVQRVIQVNFKNKKCDTIPKITMNIFKPCLH